MLLQLGVLLLFLSSLRAQRCYKVNEVWKQCSSRCEPTCDNQTQTCGRGCGPPSCQCGPGFFRDSKSSECLNKYQCAPPPPSCAVTLCAPMTQCMEREGGATCVPIPTDPIPPSGPSCSGRSPCPPGMSCVQGQYGMECQRVSVDPIPLITCENMKCRDGEYCSASEGFPKCVPAPVDPIPPRGPRCNYDSDCPSGMSCVDGNFGKECKHLTGPVEPTPPPSTCDNLRCRDGEYCSTSEGYAKCVPTPVDPIPPTGPRCNYQSDCPPGTSCVDGQYGKECKRLTGPIEPTPPPGPLPPSGPSCNYQSDCPPGTQCIDGRYGKVCQPYIDPTPPALTCDNLKCRDGEYCVNEGTGPSCKKAPVDPFPPAPRCSRRCRRRQKCVSDPINGPVCKRDDGCGPNEEMKTCSNECNEKRCGEEGLLKQCSFVCGAPKCQCSEGFFRETNTRACVRNNQCPPPIETTTTYTEPTTTDNYKPCGDTRCHPAWTCQRVPAQCNRRNCPPDSYFCMAPHTIPPPDCGGQYCSTSETCETQRVSCTRPPCPPDRKVCVLLPGATSPPAPTLPNSCGPDGMVCAEGETCQVAMASCFRSPCPPPAYECSGNGNPSYTTTTPVYTTTTPPYTTTPAYTTTTSDYGPGPTPPPSCSNVKCPYGQTCRMQQVRCYRPPCSPVPTCE